MRSVGVSANGPATKRLAELNHHRRDEGREVRNGVAGGQGLLEEDESRINEDGEDVNSRCMVQVQSVLQRQQQQLLQGPVVRWERFLPVRSLRVLLVENDDSTRHVVSALLRNCSYEVTAVANGLEAWEILENPANHIDLVLTEVVMPGLSGIGLLAKIMSHKTCKNIPLIMMSSSDSMGIVFKCLSKGAVDFLVKPIRKNELKNLWQHVWRKCHSQSSFSGSESGIRIQKPSKSKSVAESDNNTGSNDEDDNWSTGLNVKDGSDNGSGTQSSWSKRIAEVDKTQPLSQWDQLGDLPDSTCAQVIRSSSEALSNFWVPKTATAECIEKGDELDNVSMGKYLEVGVPKNQELLLEEPSRKVWKSVAGNSKNFNFKSREKNEKLEGGRMELNSVAENGKLRLESSDCMAVITNNTNPQAESVTNELVLSKFTNVKGKSTNESKKLPSLELDLNRLRDGETRTSASEQNVLKHSDLSAFSRYNTTSNANQALTGNVSSCSPPDNSSEAEKTRSMHNLESNSNGTPNQCSNDSSNNDDMGSTTNNALSKPEAFNDKQISRSLINAHPCSAFQSVKNSHNPSIPPEIQDKADPATTHTRTAHQQVQVQHHHHHHHHHVLNMQQNQQFSGRNNWSSRNKAASSSHFGPSNVLTAPSEGNAANYSLNGSASGSNNKSNGENGSNEQIANNTIGTAEGTNMANDNGGCGKCGAEDLNGSGSKNGIDQNRSAHREAALNKFLQKRKDRCFEKKVRYQSRKKLAEQRPRVKGQFVRQVVNDVKIEYPNS